MTTEELATAGLPAEPEVQDHEAAQPPEDHTSPTASGSRIHEDGKLDPRRKKLEMSMLMSKILLS
jgi:hypothetical protein